MELPMMGVHVEPINDLIEHEYEDCICGPDEMWFDMDGEPLEEPVFVHHSLDGRERFEVDAIQER